MNEPPIAEAAKQENAPILKAAEEANSRAFSTAKGENLPASEAPKVENPFALESSEQAISSLTEAPKQEDSPANSGFAEIDARFRLSSYLADQGFALVIAAVALFSLGVMLGVMDISLDGVLWIEGFLLICLALVFAADFLRKRRYYHEAIEGLSALEWSYQFPATVDEPAFLDGRLNYEISSAVARKAGNEVLESLDQAQAYRSYIELWIHETKTPIAAAKLVLASLHGEQAAKLGLEIERIEAQVDQALYYARSTSVANDYAIREISLAKVCRDACKKHASLLIESGTTPSIDIPESTKVLSDGAWLTFMLGQIIANAAKYEATTIRFSVSCVSEETSHGQTVLEIADNGIGIPASDVSQVFERGFTGINGRRQGSATGMGLYLVAVMAERMGMGVDIYSEVGKGTRLLLSFPHDRRHLTRGFEPL